MTTSSVPRGASAATISGAGLSISATGSFTGFRAANPACFAASATVVSLPGCSSAVGARFTSWTTFASVCWGESGAGTGGATIIGV